MTEAYNEIVTQAMNCETQTEADRLLHSLIDLQRATGANTLIAEQRVRNHLGYTAGYYDHEVRERVERLFKCEHPYFGSIAEVGPPTLEQAFQIGLAIGSMMRDRGEEDDYTGAVNGSSQEHQ